MPLHVEIIGSIAKQLSFRDREARLAKGLRAVRVQLANAVQHGMTPADAQLLTELFYQISVYAADQAERNETLIKQIGAKDAVIDAYEKLLSGLINDGKRDAIEKVREHVARTQRRHVSAASTRSRDQTPTTGKRV